jgi:hypothetical protein
MVQNLALTYLTFINYLFEFILDALKIYNMRILKTTTPSQVVRIAHLIVNSILLLNKKFSQRLLILVLVYFLIKYLQPNIMAAVLPAMMETRTQIKIQYFKRLKDRMVLRT